MSYIIRDSREEDAALLGPRLRACDKKEVKIASGLGPTEALTLSYENSVIRKTVVSVERNLPIAMFGATAGETLSVGHCWMLGTDALKKYPVDLVKISKLEIQAMLEEFPILTNVVWSGNTVHIRWLHHLGFKFIKPYYDFGEGKGIFLQFILHAIPMEIDKVLNYSPKTKSKEQDKSSSTEDIITISYDGDKKHV